MKLPFRFHNEHFEQEIDIKIYYINKREQETDQ